jgi:phenol hydroxylase P5 protein
MSYELSIEPLGRTIEVEDGQTILDAALRAGIYLPHACGQGYCATCKVCITDGEVDHGNSSSFALMDFEREEGLALACCARLESDMTIEVEMETDEDARDLPVRDFPGVVSRIENLTPTIKGIWLKLDNDEMLDFQAGQYINMYLPNDLGHRAFSLANVPSTGNEIELNIRIVPGGAGTAWIHNELKVGDQITVSGPYGRFFVHKSANVPSLFMAGGSGLSSPRSMRAANCRLRWSMARATRASFTTTRNSSIWRRNTPTSLTSRPSTPSRPIAAGRASAVSCTRRPRPTSITIFAATRPTCAARRS